MFYNGSPVDALLELIVELSAAHEIGDVFLKKDIEIMSCSGIAVFHSILVLPETDISLIFGNYMCQP